MNIYYKPEAFGGEIVGEVEYSSGSYEYNTVVLWKIGDKFYIGADQGCSCPTPFTGIGINDLEEITNINQLSQWLDKYHGFAWVPEHREEQVKMSEVALISKYQDQRRAFS